jgi:hypothetical protein
MTMKLRSSHSHDHFNRIPVFSCFWVSPNCDFLFLGIHYVLSLTVALYSSLFS